VAVSETNAERLMEVFREFGFGDIGIEKEDFLKPSFVIEVGQEPRKIQVLTGIDGVSFDECQKTAVEFEYLGQKIRFIGLEELSRNKKTSSRGKDLIDAQELMKGNP
jgi:hypothetical protein